MKGHVFDPFAPEGEPDGGCARPCPCAWEGGKLSARVGVRPDGKMASPWLFRSTTRRVKPGGQAGTPADGGPGGLGRERDGERDGVGLAVRPPWVDSEKKHAFRAGLEIVWTHRHEIELVPWCALEGEPGSYGGLRVCEWEQADRLGAGAMLDETGRDVMVCQAHKAVMEARVEERWAGIRRGWEEELAERDAWLTRRAERSLAEEPRKAQPVSNMKVTDPGFRGF